MDVRLHSAEAPVHTVGPGPAAGIWTQGCPHACRGCMTRGSWSANAGALAHIDDVAEWLDSTGLAYLTISGGEPLDQAGPLSMLIDLLRQNRPWIVTAYSGYELEDLIADPTSARARLVDRLDVLIDGLYVEDLHVPLRWRGSSNQRIHLLTGQVTVTDDDSVGVAVHVDDDGSARFIGVPPTPDFMRQISTTLRQGGTPVEIDRGRPFPFRVRRDG